MNENARRAYAAYKAYLDGTFAKVGTQFPTWDSLNETHQKAWEAAVAALCAPEKRVGEYAAGSGW